MSWEQEGFDRRSIFRLLCRSLKDYWMNSARMKAEEELLTPRAAGKWSRQQIIGHLVDSALKPEAFLRNSIFAADLCGATLSSK